MDEAHLAPLSLFHIGQFVRACVLAVQQPTDSKTSNHAQIDVSLRASRVHSVAERAVLNKSEGNSAG